jgi:hypothetical protein
MVEIRSLLVFVGEFEAHAGGPEPPFQVELGDLSFVVESSGFDVLGG